MILYIKLWKDATIFANGFLDFAMLGVEGAYHMHNAKDVSVEIYGGHIAFNKPGPDITQSQSARLVYLTEKTGYWMKVLHGLCQIMYKKLSIYLCFLLINHQIW